HREGGRDARERGRGRRRRRDDEQQRGGVRGGSRKKQREPGGKRSGGLQEIAPGEARQPKRDQQQTDVDEGMAAQDLVIVSTRIESTFVVHFLRGLVAALADARLPLV